MPHPHAPNSPWTEGREAMLRDLWARTAPDGKPLLSERAIGRVLGGMTKDQVHSKVRRLDLPKRDDPAERSPRDAQPPPPPSLRARPPLPAGACTLPPLASLVGWEP